MVKNSEGISFDDQKRIIFKGDYIDDEKQIGIEYNYQGIFNLDKNMNWEKKSEN